MNGVNNETLDDLKRFLRYKNSTQELSEEDINSGFGVLNSKYNNEGIVK